jgi:hypothetical protein
MIFTLEALNAKYGDSLLLHYGKTNATRKLMVIDGGPPGVYKQTLRPRLMELKADLDDSEPLPIRLLMVSHIDEDHVAGVQALTGELVKDQDDDDPLPFDIATLWHNSFEDIIKGESKSTQASFAAALEIRKEDKKLPDSVVTQPETIGAMNGASVAQGREVRNNADKLGLNINEGFNGEMILVTKKGKKKINFDGLSFTVLGPNQTNLDNLQVEWAKELEKLKKKKKPKSQVVEYLDKTATNLSSIIVLAEFGGKSMLLTGDARGDFVVEGLTNAGILKENQSFHVDLFKIPHHGSDRNAEKSLFQRVTAECYVISADGKYGNPDNKTLQMLSDARGQDPYTIYLTNTLPRLVKFFKEEKQKGKKYKVVFRDENKPSLQINLGDAL